MYIHIQYIDTHTVLNTACPEGACVLGGLGGVLGGVAHCGVPPLQDLQHCWP